MQATATVAEIASSRDEVRLHVRGELNAGSVASWRAAFETVAQSTARRVVLDLAGLSAIDGSGLGAIAYLFKRLLARGRTLVVTSVAGQPLALLREMGLADLFGLDQPPVRGGVWQRWFGGMAAAGGH